MSGEPQSGWGWPGAARKAHYFDGGAISLCRRWMYVGPLTRNQEGSSPDDCVVCTRALAKLELAKLPPVVPLVADRAERETE